MITQKYLKECLHYCPYTGVFSWLKDRPLHHFKRPKDRLGWLKKFAGRKAGYLSVRGCRVINFRGRCHKEHILAWIYMYDKHPDNVIDHIDGDPANNAIENLRDVPVIVNQQNCKMSKNNKSGVNGVYWSSRSSKWVAEIKINYKKKRIGTFEKLEDAAKARKKAELIHGFHPNHGRKKEA